MTAPAADPALRGRLTLADRVVEKVAAQAVGEVGRAGGTPRRVLGQTVRRASATGPVSARARVDGPTVSLTVSMSVVWPAPVPEVAAEVRRIVRERVAQICGMRVTDVDVVVPAFLPAPSRVSSRPARPL